MNYEELKELTYEEKRGILLMAYSDESEDFRKGLVLGMKAGLPDGWVQIAPAWVKEYKKLEAKFPSMGEILRRKG